VAEESQDERLDRELIELLNELRVALPGVQVLFAFLLILPFQQRFQQLGDFDRYVFFTAFITTTAATAMLITPTAFHRIRFRDADKEWLIKLSNLLAIVGLFFLAIAIVCTVFLITDVLFGGWPAILASAIAAVLFAVLWYGIALYREVRA
jgi:hypothetical protein